jgi:hypothetical protein
MQQLFGLDLTGRIFADWKANQLKNITFRNMGIGTAYHGDSSTKYLVAFIQKFTRSL